MRMLGPKVLSACWMCSVIPVGVCFFVAWVNFNVVSCVLWLLVCWCGPHDKRHSLAIFCCMYCVPVGRGWLGYMDVSETCPLCLGLPLML